MKRLIKVLFAAIISVNFCLFAQELDIHGSIQENQVDKSEDLNDEAASFTEDAAFNDKDDDDFDSMFDDTEDTDAIVIVPEKESESKSSKRGIVFDGNLDTVLGGYLYGYPDKEMPVTIIPAVLFDTKMSFSARPSQYFSIHGTFYASFPEMQFGVHELYMNYSLWDVAYLMAGQKVIKWGNSRILDTNIMDDENSYDKSLGNYDPDDILNKRDNDINKSKFTIQLSVPIKRVNLIGIMDYKNYDKQEIDFTNPNIEKLTGDLAFAGMVDVAIKNVAFDVFIKKWATNDVRRYAPAVGFDFNWQLKDLHLYTQYYAHFMPQSDMWFPRMKFTQCIWWATRDGIDLGFNLEYQLLYNCYKGIANDADNPKDAESPCRPADPSDHLYNYLAFEAAWGHIFGSKFTLGLKYFHDFMEEYGTIVPGVKVHNILPHANLDLGFPIYYGSIQKYGVALQLRLKVDY